MKKVLAFLAAVLMLFSVTACGKDTENPANDNSSSTGLSTKDTTGEGDTSSAADDVRSKISNLWSSKESTETNNSVSLSKRNALSQAKSYLSFTSFSREGLITQLEFEKFPNEDAIYAADNCGADWNEQAVKKAKSYLDTTSFSYQGLIEQLEYEKFTSDQAKYGVDNCGADWNEQAVEKAKSYLEISSFSRQGLIDQLEFEGFTHDQAVHGVTTVGL